MISLESIEKCGFELIERSAGIVILAGTFSDFQGSFVGSPKTIKITIKAPITGDSVILESAQVTANDGKSPVPSIWQKEDLELTLVKKLRALETAAHARERLEEKEQASRKPDFSEVIFHLESAAIAYQEALRNFKKKPEAIELSILASTTIDQFFKKQPNA